MAEKKTKFSTGDYVVYPTHGVGKVTGVEDQEIAGDKLKLIVINFEKDRMVLRVPIAKAETSGLRQLSSRDEMKAAMKTLRGRSRVRRTMWSRRAQEQPDQSYSERQIYQAAFERLMRELAVVEEIDEDAATEKLQTVLTAA